MGGSFSGKSLPSVMGAVGFFCWQQFFGWHFFVNGGWVGRAVIIFMEMEIVVEDNFLRSLNNLICANVFNVKNLIRNS